MGYRVWDDAIQTELRLIHIKRRSGEINGQLSITTNIAGVKTHNGVLHVANFNVMSSSARNTLAKLLQARTPQHPEMDWFDGLEWLCQSVIMAETRGEVISEIGHEPITPPDQRWAVQPLVLRGRPSLLFGPGGVGKSLIALACALSVAAEREIIPGLVPGLTGPVLYLDWETTPGVINDRIQAIAAGHGFKPVNMLYRRCIRPLADDAEELSMIVAERGVVMIVVDSAAYAMGASREYGDANESILRMHDAIRMIGVTSQIVDHVAKSEARGRGGTATPYGSAYKTNAARISWEIRKATTVSGMAINLYHAKGNDTRDIPPFSINLDWEDTKIVFRRGEVSVELDEEAEVNTAAAIQELLEGGRMKSGDIERTLEAFHQPATVRKNLSRMVAKGIIFKDEAGLYYLPVGSVRLRSLPGSKGMDA